MRRYCGIVKLFSIPQYRRIFDGHLDDLEAQVVRHEAKLDAILTEETQ